MTSAWAAAAPAARLPRVAVMGALRMGFGGVLVRAGLPFDYLTVAEHSDLAALKRYDLILAAAMNYGNEPWLGSSLSALDAYLASGGRAVLEQGVRPNMATRGLGTLRVVGHRRHDMTFGLEPGDNPLAQRLPAGRQWSFGSEVEMLRCNDQGLQVLARFTNNELRGQPAIVSGPAGQGRWVYWPTDLAYLQGNWTPDFDDLFLAVIDWLTDGRAKPQWGTKPAPSDEPAEPSIAPAPAAGPPSATDLGSAPADGYCLRTPLPKKGTGRLYIEWAANAAERGWLLETSAQRATLRAAGAVSGKSFAVTANSDLVLVRRPEALVLAQDGHELGRVAVPARPGRHCFAQDLTEPLLQPAEPVWFTDDFATNAGPTENSVWQPVNGNWSLTGQTPAVSNTPGFALRGDDGLSAAGAWYWSGYGLAASVRPVGAKALRLQVGRWDADHALELRLGVGQAAPVTLTERRGEQTLKLGEAAADVPANQWLRLRLRRDGAQWVAELDGRRLLAASDGGDLMGGVALGAEGGAAIFDDVRAAADTIVEGLPRVHPPAFDKGPEGLLDRDTWASTAAAWLPSEEQGLLWHVGRFAGDLELHLPWRGPGPLTVHAGSERGARAPLLTVEGPHASVTVARRGGQWQAVIDGQPRAVTGPAGAVCLGLDLGSPGVSADEVELRAADVHEYLFQQAPVDWWERDGLWHVDSRWICQPQWSWLVGQNDGGVAALWHKRKLVGDFVMEVPLSVRMRGGYGEPGSEPFERLRVGFCGDGRDPKSGYTLEIGSDQESCALYRAGRQVATAKGHIPHWREIHNAWYDVRIERHGATLTAWFHGRPLLSFTDAQPLADGYPYLWTERNGLVTPYVALYGAEAPL